MSGFTNLYKHVVLKSRLVARILGENFFQTCVILELTSYAWLCIRLL